ncbi:hypothetical protein M9H77_22688 [Catharanthus roseus]|uniref:Uncharacterized protein n=1 Tax=Catharanthus roseus TaxID=4058 RepID=A0ACC0ASV7_CATRO|nr:hypothetical protein M9H77_22688 [Catharanthus roseus]
MEAINPVRVMLFWDSKIARDVYGPYFTGTIRKSWTLPTNRIISHAELSVSITHDTNTINMTKHVTTVIQMVSDEPSMLYPTVDDNDDENNHSTKKILYLVNQNQTIIMTLKKKSYKLP